MFAARRVEQQPGRLRSPSAFTMESDVAKPTPWKLKHSKRLHSMISAFFAIFAVQISAMRSTPAPGLADCASRSAFEDVKNSIAASVYFRARCSPRGASNCSRGGCAPHQHLQWKATPVINRHTTTFHLPTHSLLFGENPLSSSTPFQFLLHAGVAKWQTHRT